MSARFSLFLFSTDPETIRVAVRSGVAGLVVDWEHIDKERRQAGADTQINRDTVQDLRRARACTNATILCRTNNCERTSQECEEAIAAGADEILLPMVRSLREVEGLLEQVNGRCGVGILIETQEAVGLSPELGRLPLSRVYIGLNDLAIERNAANLFEPLLDGTIEAVRRSIHAPLGFAGLTLPDRGYPVPCRLLMGEMCRLQCGFSFLRRSFYRDMEGHAPSVQIPRLLTALEEARGRPCEAVARDSQELKAAILAWPADAQGRGGA